MTNLANLADPATLPDKYPGVFTDAQVRYMIRNRHASGLDAATVKIGRKILLDMEKFREWMDTQTEAKITAARYG